MTEKLSSAVIVGVVRDAEASLALTLQKVEALRARLADSRVVIATNDNSDGTSRILAEWASAGNGHEVLTFDGLAAAAPNKIDRMAVVRNLVLAHTREASFPKFKHQINIDLDGPNRSLDIDAVIGAIESASVAWDALFANQVEAYYDVYALRHPTWCPRDCWDEVVEVVHWPFRTIKRRRAVDRFVRLRQYHIDPATPPIPVDSAFGGLGVYRISAMDDCWYGSRTPTGAVVCEHVVLHEQMRRRGARLFVLPNLLNEAPKEHLDTASGQAPPQEFIS